MLHAGFLLFFLVGFVRALPWPAAWKQRKPLACHACMVGWASIALAAGNWSLQQAFPDNLLPGAGLALLLLMWLDTRAAPPDFAGGETVGPPSP